MSRESRCRLSETKSSDGRSFVWQEPCTSTHSMITHYRATQMQLPDLIYGLPEQVSRCEFYHGRRHPWILCTCWFYESLISLTTSWGFKQSSCVHNESAGCTQSTCDLCFVISDFFWKDNLEHRDSDSDQIGGQQPLVLGTPLSRAPISYRTWHGVTLCRQAFPSLLAYRKDSSLAASVRLEVCSPRLSEPGHVLVSTVPCDG